MTQVYMIPGDALDPANPAVVGASLVMPYGVWGRVPERRLDDVVMSIQKHLAEVLDLVGGEWLPGFNTDGEPVLSPTWEVRLWDEPTAFRLPFVRVAAVGPDTVTKGAPTYADHSQTFSVHLYPHPAQDAERAILGADRLRATITDAFEFGAGRAAGFSFIVPLWDFQGANGDLYADSEARFPSDWVRVEGFTAQNFPDPEDDRYVAVVLSFRVQWRRTSRVLPGHLVQSVRMAAHPE